MDWHFDKLSLTIEDIIKVENEVGVTFPAGYKKILITHHGARPENKRFKTGAQKERMIKTFIPVTDDYEINLFSVSQWLNLKSSFVPFASTPSGDYLCFFYQNKEPYIVLYHHETSLYELISNNFNDFIKSLY